MTFTALTQKIASVFRPKAETNPFIDAFIEVRDAHTMAWHILQLDSVGKADYSSATLCGSKNWVLPHNKKVLTINDVLSTLGSQHETWHWCKDCAVAFTGIDKNDPMLSYRRESRPQRSGLAVG